MQSRFAVLCCACAAFWLPPAAAQQQAAAAHPADPRALVPPPQYSSAFNSYRPFRDEKPGPWREINDEVARVGGHLGIFRSSAPAAQGATPATNPHAGHHPGATK